MRHLTKTLLLASALLAACTPFQPPREDARSTWELNPELPSGMFASSDTTLNVARPTAISALATNDMAYRESAYQRRYYARNQWIDAPARLLHPLFIDAVESAGLFATVVGSGVSAPADYRLESELLEFEHDYTRRDAGVARVVLRARLVEAGSGQVLSTQRFRAEVDSREAGPAPGVAATNRAVGDLLHDMVRWLNAEIGESISS